LKEAMPRSFLTVRVIRTALLGLFLVALKANSQAAADASDEDIVEVLAPELSDVRLLTMQDLTREQTDNIGNTPEVGRRFEGDFDADGRPDLALFGSYASGTFVLVASRDQFVWHRSGLLQFTRPFIVGRADQGVLRVFFCTGCDSGGRVLWTGSGYEFVPFPPVGVPE
jgi:hypothetical protein